MSRPAYNNDELLRKAAVAVSDITNGGGVLQPEQLEQFLRITQVSQAILREARVEIVSRGQKLLDRTGMTSQFLGPGVEDDTTQWTDPATFFAGESKPTLASIPLNTKKLTGRTSVSWETLQRNIEKEGFADTLVEIMAERAAFDLEYAGLNGDTTLSNDGSFDHKLLRMYTGFLKRVPAANTIDWGHAVINRYAFLQAINSVPARFRRNISEFRFYVSHGIELAYRDLLALRGTPLGDVAQTEDGTLKVYGVPVVGIDSMPNNLGSLQDEGIIFFAHPKNLIWGVEDASVDVQVEEVNAIAKVVNVQWQLGGS